MLYTEKEYLIQNEHSTFRLKNLYKENRNLFYEIVDYLPFPMYVNCRKTFDYQFFSDSFFSYGQEIENLYLEGGKYLPTISEPFLLKNAINKARKFSLLNDYDSICSYLQCVSLNKKMTHYYTNKCLIDDELTLNTTVFLNQQNTLAKLFRMILPESNYTLRYWQRFQSLTKQEKLILHLIANGNNSKVIGEQLCISIHTVATHRKNISNKLDASSLADLIRFSMVLELL